MNQEPSHDDLFAESSTNGALPDGDSLLTAHALDELTDGDRAIVEAHLRESSGDRQAVEQTARLGKLLRQVAADQRLAERSPEVREAVIAALEGPPQLDDQHEALAGDVARLLATAHGAQSIADGSAGPAADADQVEPALHLPERFPHRRIWLPLSLAASLLVVCSAVFGLMKLKHTEIAVAQNDHSPSLSGATVDISNPEDLPLLELQTHLVTEDLSGVPADTLIVDAPVGSAGDRSMLSANGGMTTGVPTLPDQNAPAAEAPPRFFSASLDANRRGEPGSGGGMGGFGAGGVPGGGVVGGGFSLERQGGGQHSNRHESASGPSRLAPRVPALQEFIPPTNLQSPSGKSLAGRRGQREVAGGDKSGGGQRANAQQGQDRQRQQVAAEGESRERINRELYLQKQNVDHLGGRQRAWFLNGGHAEQEVDSNAIFGGSTPDTESYPALIENPFLKPTEHPLSTFSIDVDTASYANVRRFLNSHGMPPADAVRIEELINYFQYDYPQPDGETPFSITTDVADCPWNAGHRLLRVGLKGREVPVDDRPASNLVFLLDVSGSMSATNKLPLVKEAMYLLTERLTENDRVSIVVYAGNSGLVLPPTNGTDKTTIRQAIGQLAAGGSTNGGQGLQMAYDTAQSNFIQGGTNRVILATDGDFNVGIVDQNELVRFIEERAKSGVFLSALGFGIGNLKDGTLEKLADKGNGNYAYIDTLAEARRVLVEQLSGTLVTIAKDVKIQIEFNPAQAAEYRLIGYEDRVMPHQDFHDDRKDAGEIGAGHTVTALYEIVPAERAVGPGGEPLKYQRSEALTPAADNGELATIKLRYKEPDGQQSRLLERAITDRRPAQAAANRDMNFAAAVAAFGMLLRDSSYRGDASYTKVLAWAEQGISSDTNGYRSEFLELVRLAREISGKE